MRELRLQSSPRSLRSPARMRAGCASPIGLSKGFTYLGVLFLIVFMGLALAAVAHVWHVSIQRDKEAELLFVGGQFRNAIQRYSEISPGNASKQEFPKKLEDLLEDKRFGTSTMRHLRKIYFDPMTGKPDWELVVLPGIGIVGVHSKSEGTPIKSAGFPAEFDKFSEAKNYTDWVFSPTTAPTTASPPGTTPAGMPVSPAGTPLGGMSTTAGAPPSAAPGAGVSPGTGNPVSAPPDPKAVAEAACQSSYAMRTQQCNTATDRGAALGGQSCLDRAMRALNDCMSNL